MKAGDIILLHSGKSFIPRGITAVMKRYIRKNELTCKPYHHAGILIDVNGQLMVAEATIEGWTIRSMYDAYPVEVWANRIDVFTPIVPYSAQEVYRLSQAALNYSMQVTRYDFMNFVWWLWYMAFGNWIGKNNDRLYCSEGAAEVTNRIRSYFDNPQRTNPVDCAVNRHYRMDSI